MKRLNHLFFVVLLLMAPLYSQTAPRYVWAIAGDGRYLYAAGWQQGVFRSPDGKSWELVDSRLKEVRALLADAALGVFAANQMRGLDPDSLMGVFHSTDQGRTWQSANKGLTNRFVTSFVFTPTQLLAGVHDSQEGKGVYRSCDNGKSWAQVSQVMQWGVVSFAYATDGTVYAGARGSGVWRSSDQGETWIQVNNGLVNPWITSVATTRDGIFASVFPFGGGIFYSDNGEDWRLVYSDLKKNPRVMCLATAQDGTVFGGAYTDGGIYAGGVIRSVDGKSWQQVAGTEGMSVAALFAQGNEIFVGTLGDGVKKINITTLPAGQTGVDDTEGVIPSTYGLEQNYPNPFNPTTRISFQLPQSGEVTLTIYNILGQSIRTLAKGERPAGYYTVEWDGRNNYGEMIQSGIYFYLLESGSFTAMKKMLLVK